MSFSSSVILKKSTERPPIVVETSYDLIECVKQEIDKYGWDADLNHIDVSKVTDFSRVFEYSEFNGDISKWDVSKGESFISMFAHSKFNGNILAWDTSSAIYFTGMFSHSEFNNDISLWDTRNVRTMRGMFEGSKFNKDIGMWNIDNVTDMSYMFSCSEFKHNLYEWMEPEYCNCENMFFRVKLPDHHWYFKKNIEYKKEIDRMGKIEWSEENHSEISLDNLKKLDNGKHIVYLNRDTGKLMSQDDADVSTLKLMSFTINEMSEQKWKELYGKIKETERKCLSCVYKSTLYGIYPNDFIMKLKPWKIRKNPYTNRSYDFVSLYLIASINWHAKLAGLPCIKKEGKKLIEIKP